MPELAFSCDATEQAQASDRPDGQWFWDRAGDRGDVVFNRIEFALPNHKVSSVGVTVSIRIAAAVGVVRRLPEAQITSTHSGIDLKVRCELIFDELSLPGENVAAVGIAVAIRITAAPLVVRHANLG